ncbi:MAG: hypothetical protein E7343_05660 [Clostridiales bacterium]|nr:hypothetical protein [Clostridiales bacterium]
MKKKFLRVLAGALAVCFAFGASGCSIIDSVKSWFGELQYEEITDEEEQNEAFKKIKGAYQNTYEYNGVFTATFDGYISESYNGEKNAKREYDACLSVDTAQKRYYSETTAGKNKHKTKQYEAEGDYYFYCDSYTPYWGSQKTYKTLSPIKTNYEYLSTNIGGWLEALNMHDGMEAMQVAPWFNGLSSLFYTESFAEFKNINKQVFDEGQSLWRENVELSYKYSEFNKNLLYNKIFIKPKASETEAKTSSSVLKSKEGENLLKIVMELKTPVFDTYTGSSKKLKVSLFVEIWLFEKDGKIAQCKIIEKYTNSLDDCEINKNYLLNFDYSFDEDKFNAFQIDSSVQPSSDSYDNTINKDLTFVLEDKEILLKFEIDINDTVETFFAKLANGQGLHNAYCSVSGVEGMNFEGIYTDEEHTQYYDVRTATMEEFLRMEKFYIDIEIKDGYAMITNNYKIALTQTENKYFLYGDKYSDIEILKLEEGNLYSLTSEYTYVNGIKTASSFLLCEEKCFYNVECVSTFNLFKYLFYEAGYYYL